MKHRDRSGKEKKNIRPRNKKKRKLIQGGKVDV
jgi:hypothetical protein